MSHYEEAIKGAAYAGKWIGEESVAVNAPVEAQIATVHALLAVADEIRNLRVVLADAKAAESGRST